VIDAPCDPDKFPRRRYATNSLLHGICFGESDGTLESKGAFRPEHRNGTDMIIFTDKTSKDQPKASAPKIAPASDSKDEPKLSVAESDLAPDEEAASSTVLPKGKKHTRIRAASR
jgi:hypothetical protein